MNTFHECCALVYRNCPDGYAKAYAQAGLSECPNIILGEPISPDVASTIRTQSLYILNNMQYWRGTVARQVKAELTRYSRI